MARCGLPLLPLGVEAEFVDTMSVLRQAQTLLDSLPAEVLPVLEVIKPTSTTYALQLTKLLSKLSPLVGNLVELALVEMLNQRGTWPVGGHWVRQDPGIPDALFVGDIHPAPGIEIKTWFPLATEMTARFRESQRRLAADNTALAIVAWLPEYVIYGRPQVIGVWTGSGLDMAQTRDAHYHLPPYYVVIEPEDTTLRTANLQQTNVNGYRIQEDADGIRRAETDVIACGMGAYRVEPDYQSQVRALLAQYRYRLDTNFGKLDRIQHPDLEAFKTQILNTEFRGQRIMDWATTDLLAREERLEELLGHSSEG